WRAARRRTRRSSTLDPRGPGSDRWRRAPPRATATPERSKAFAWYQPSSARPAARSARKTAAIARGRELRDRADREPPHARRWESRGDRAGFVHVLGLDEEESTQLLLGLGKGADAAGDFPGLDADGPGRAGPFQSVRGDVMAAPLELLGVLDRGVDERLHLLLGHRVQHLLVVMDREHELHRILLPSVSGIALHVIVGKIYQPDSVMWPGVRARAPRRADTARSPARPRESEGSRARSRSPSGRRRAP